MCHSERIRTELYFCTSLCGMVLLHLQFFSVGGIRIYIKVDDIFAQPAGSNRGNHSGVAAMCHLFGKGTASEKVLQLFSPM